jgi:hypothetical protein
MPIEPVPKRISRYRKTDYFFFGVAEEISSRCLEHDVGDEDLDAYREPDGNKPNNHIHPVPAPPKQMQFEGPGDEGEVVMHNL